MVMDDCCCCLSRGWLKDWCNGYEAREVDLEGTGVEKVGKARQLLGVSRPQLACNWFAVHGAHVNTYVG